MVLKLKNMLFKLLQNILICCTIVILTKEFLMPIIQKLNTLPILEQKKVVSNLKPNRRKKTVYPTMFALLLSTAAMPVFAQIKKISNNVASSVTCAESDCPSANSRVMRATGSKMLVRAL